MHFKIATRNSNLGKAQAKLVGQELEKNNNTYEIVPVDIEDISQDKSKKKSSCLYQACGKGLFVNKIHEAVKTKQADIAVFSVKDVPNEKDSSSDFVMPAVLKRNSHRDVVITRKNDTFLMLEKGSKVGVTSVRRASQLTTNFPYFKVVDLVGDVDDRIAKLDNKEVDAVILSKADVKLLGLDDRIDEVLESDIMMPALGQGIISVECLKDNPEVIKELEKINHQETMDCLLVEREIANYLDCNCYSPIAGYCEYSAGGSLRVVALVSSLDGSKIIRSRMKEKDIEPKILGKRVAKHLLEQGAEEIINSVKKDCKI